VAEKRIAIYKNNIKYAVVPRKIICFWLSALLFAFNFPTWLYHSKYCYDITKLLQ